MLYVAIPQDPTPVHAKLDIRETVNLAAVSCYILLFTLVKQNSLTTINNSLPYSRGKMMVFGKCLPQAHGALARQNLTFESVGIIRNHYGLESLLGYVYK